MKKVMSIVLSACLALSISACGSNNTQKNTADNNKANTSVEQKEDKKLEDKLIIYSTHPENLLEVVSTEFEEKTGVDVEFINLKGELAEKVLAEKEDPQADIMYGGSSATYLELQKEDVFQATTPSWAGDLNPLFKDEKGLWYGTIQTPVMIFYNNEIINKEDAPKDWKDLVDPKFENQLVFRNAGSSSAKATYSSLLYQYDKAGNLDEGWEYMKALDKNTKKYYSSGSLQFQAVGRKEASVSFAVLSSIIVNKDKGLPLEIVDAESGSPVITDGVAMINNAKHPEAAQAFIEFVGSPEIQAKLANEFNRMPTLQDAIDNSPQWMKDSKYKVMDVDWSVLSEKQGNWMQKWDSEIKDTNKDGK